MTKSEFIEMISKIIVKENKKRGYPLFSSVVIAQACLETGYGSSQMMMKSHAIFGIKATKAWKGMVYNSKTKECYNNTSFVEINACFRAYKNYEESIADYFDLICKTHRYRKALVTETPTECITAIKNGGYATDPFYVSKIMSIINKNNLTRYDNNSIFEFVVNKTYTLLVDLKVRDGAGTEFRQKDRSELTQNAKNNSLNKMKAVLKKGTKVTCQRIIKRNDEIWIKIPSGFICAKYKGKEYIK